MSRRARNREQEEWRDVVTARLGSESAGQLTRARRRRLLESLGTLAGRGRGADAKLDPAVQSLLKLIGLEHVSGELAEIVSRGAAAGVDRDALPHVLQAYVRAVARIVAAETNITLDVLRGVEPERREAVIAELIAVGLPASLRGFDLLHTVMLQDALLEAAPILDDDNSEPEQLAIGMVDLVKSTAYMTACSAEELEHLVDAIFAAAQVATARRAAHLVKYVGDGAYIAGNDPLPVADAAHEMIESLQANLPLRARAGVSYGFVVQRAGDLFGPPINLVSALTKAARPGAVLLSADAARRIPTSRRGRIRRRRLPHHTLSEHDVATYAPRSRGWR